MMNLELRKIMNTQPTVAHPDQDVQVLSHEMLNNGIQQMPVVDNGKLLGMLTTYDLWRKYENLPTLKGLKVKDVMNNKVIKLSPKDKVGTAAELFADRRFKTLPIVNLDDTLKGTITAFDIIKLAFKEEYKNPIIYAEELS